MKYFLYGFIVFLILPSCISQKKLLYFQTTETNKTTVDRIALDTSMHYQIQPGDLLNIEVSSTVASNTDLFSKKFDKTDGPTTAGGKGYSVDGKGNIELPLVGIIHVEGLTIEEINNEIKNKISQYLDYTFVKTSLINFRISILGEVSSPGTQIVLNDNVTIFQAIGMAGDITPLGNKKKVKIIRKVKNETEVITLDLSQNDVLSSKYYYLFPNDVVYVEPLRAKAFKLNAPTIALVLSSISILLLIYTRVQ